MNQDRAIQVIGEVVRPRCNIRKKVVAYNKKQASFLRLNILISN